MVRGRPRGSSICARLVPEGAHGRLGVTHASVVFVVDDIEAACERLTCNGVRLSQNLVAMAWGKFAAFVDTEGNEFGLRT